LLNLLLKQVVILLT
jgi:hypothetical protein